MQKLKKLIKKANIDSDESSSDLDHQVDQNNYYQQKPTNSDRESALFQAYRALGYYTSSVPLVVFKDSQDMLIASVVGGHAFYVFNSQKLNLIYMSRFINEEITGIQVGEDGIVYTTLAESNQIQAWKKMHRVRTYKPIVDLGAVVGDGQQSPKIIQTIVTKSFIFCLCEGGYIFIFNTQTSQIVKQLSFKNNKLIGMMHPLTYLNKLLLWDQKHLVLHNVIEDQEIFQFKALESTIEVVVQTPVLNVVAIGCKDGTIILLNLLFDEVLLTFKQKQGAVNQISFLTDSNLGLSLMATACKEGGVIALWDLNAKKIWAEMKTPHSGRNINSICFVPNEPVLVSASEDDNSIKMWLLEKGQSEPRLLRERTGHAEAPSKIRFYGGLDDPTNQGARNLITCSPDGNLRDISLLNEFQSMNFSKKNQLKKTGEGTDLGAVSTFDFSQFRERDWANCLTAHSKTDQSDISTSTYLWSYANHSISKLQVQSSVKQGRVTSVAVSLCGNFGVLGFETGIISKFNLQSGIDKGIFKSENGSGLKELHTAEVTGLGIDALNKVLVSGSLDRTVKLWDFYRAKLLKTFTCDYPISNLTYNKLNDLVAFSSSDLSITLLNAKNFLQKVRSFPHAASNKITDICFSQPDQRWLICSSLDRCIRVWDIVTGLLVDWFKFKNAPLSLDFSPSGEFLATSHVNSKAVFLWSNKTYFQNVVVQKVPKKPIEIDMPDLSTTETVKKSHSDFYLKDKQAKQVNDEVGLLESKLKQLDSEVVLGKRSSDRKLLVTLSDQPFSKFQAIFNLEQIKQRNKPKLQKESLPSVPFFLFDLEKATTGESGEHGAKDFLRETFFTSFEKKRKAMVKEVGGAAMAKNGVGAKKLSEILAKKEDVLPFLKSLSPSGVELEIMTLGNFDFNNAETTPNQLILAFLEALQFHIKQSTEVDYAQALLNCCLKIHHDTITTDEELIKKIKEIRLATQQGFSRMEDLLNHNICMISSFTGVQISQNSYNV